MRLTLLLGLAAMLAGDTPAVHTTSFSTAHTIVCGETKRMSPGGHILALQFRCSATAGDVLSFASYVHGGDYYLTVHNQEARSDRNGEAKLCGWIAPETGEYIVGLYGAAHQEYYMWLTMHCGSPPAICSVPVSSHSWSRVKALFH